jgi:hypothetical protein
VVVAQEQQGEAGGLRRGAADGGVVEAPTASAVGPPSAEAPLLQASARRRGFGQAPGVGAWVQRPMRLRMASRTSEGRLVKASSGSIFSR